jgi:peptidoglycan/xylan/chitin deacetylase (PgdA/CDA1 family)
VSAAPDTVGGKGRPRIRGSFRGSLITRAAGRPPVLMYHSVGPVDDDPFHLVVSPPRFARQIAALRRVGLRGVSIRELDEAVADRGVHGLVGITFDDGYRDVLPHAIPVLEHHGFTATVFAVSGLLGGTNSWDPPPRRDLMTEADLRQLTAAGHEVGSHSATHVRLAGLDPEHLREEIMGSREALARLLGSPPRSFCYPYGSVDAAAARCVEEAGYTSACAVTRVPGLSTRYAVPRIGVGEVDATRRFLAKLLLRGR